jgi:hypothetical protein
VKNHKEEKEEEKGEKDNCRESTKRSFSFRK